MKCIFIMLTIFDAGSPLHVNTCQIAAVTKKTDCSTYTGERKPCTRVWMAGGGDPFAVIESQDEVVKKLK